MKLTESRLRKIIREEMEAFGEDGSVYLYDFQEYLSSSARKKNPYEFEYGRYTIGLDPMGAALHVNIKVEGSAPSYEPSVSATIENDTVRYTMKNKTGRPQTQKEPYQYPEQVIDKMVKAAPGSPTV
jgi:hypothetical protein